MCLRFNIFTLNSHLKARAEKLPFESILTIDNKFVASTACTIKCLMGVFLLSQSYKQVRGGWWLTGEDLEVIWADFSTVS